MIEEKKFDWNKKEKSGQSKIVYEFSLLVLLYCYRTFYISRLSEEFGLSSKTIIRYVNELQLIDNQIFVDYEANHKMVVEYNCDKYLKHSETVIVLSSNLSIHISKIKRMLEILEGAMNIIENNLEDDVTYDNIFTDYSDALTNKVLRLAAKRLNNGYSSKTLSRDVKDILEAKKIIEKINYF